MTNIIHYFIYIISNLSIHFTGYVELKETSCIKLDCEKYPLISYACCSVHLLVSHWVGLENELPHLHLTDEYILKIKHSELLNDYFFSMRSDFYYLQLQCQDT